MTSGVGTKLLQILEEAASEAGPARPLTREGVDRAIQERRNQLEEDNARRAAEMKGKRPGSNYSARFSYNNLNH
jgi:hypothetical protein